jgi:hypothetical protein
MAHFKVQSGSVIASPNVIPMADIMLVLLIIVHGGDSSHPERGARETGGGGESR